MCVASDDIWVRDMVSHYGAYQKGQGPAEGDGGNYAWSFPTGFNQ